jgi:hypothetical protein
MIAPLSRYGNSIIYLGIGVKEISVKDFIKLPVTLLSIDFRATWAILGAHRQVKVCGAMGTYPAHFTKQGEG